MPSRERDEQTTKDVCSVYQSVCGDVTMTSDDQISPAPITHIQSHSVCMGRQSTRNADEKDREAKGIRIRNGDHQGENGNKKKREINWEHKGERMKSGSLALEE